MASSPEHSGARFLSVGIGPADYNRQLRESGIVQIKFLDNRIEAALSTLVP
jgi:hypothetical protein